MGQQKNAAKVNEDSALAIGRHIRTSPRKLNIVAQMIRGKDVSKALAELTFCRRRIADEVHKVLQAAVANAENNQQLDIDRLYVAEASVGRTLVMKRWHARARGRGSRIEKPFSNLTVIVRERAEQPEDDGATGGGEE